VPTETAITFSNSTRTGFARKEKKKPGSKIDVFNYLLPFFKADPNAIPRLCHIETPYEPKQSRASTHL
jgi:hypothetical protein